VINVVVVVVDKGTKALIASNPSDTGVRLIGFDPNEISIERALLDGGERGGDGVDPDAAAAGQIAVADLNIGIVTAQGVFV
jgi:hypothetical protein